MRSIHPFVLFALAASLAAQGAIVSPVGSATVEGDSNNIFPFGQATARRYMQIHADLGTTPLVITKLTFRVNSPTTATTYSGTRTHDIEVWNGFGPGTTDWPVGPNVTSWRGSTVCFGDA